MRRRILCVRVTEPETMWIEGSVGGLLNRAGSWHDWEMESSELALLRS